MLGAVEQGMGCSILPEFVCAESIREGRTEELYPVADLIAPEPWYACVRQGEVRPPSPGCRSLLPSRLRAVAGVKGCG